MVTATRAVQMELRRFQSVNELIRRLFLSGEFKMPWEIYGTHSNGKYFVIKGRIFDGYVHGTTCRGEDFIPVFTTKKKAHRFLRHIGEPVENYKLVEVRWRSLVEVFGKTFVFASVDCGGNDEYFKLIPLFCP